MPRPDVLRLGPFLYLPCRTTGRAQSPCPTRLRALPKRSTHRRSNQVAFGCSHSRYLRTEARLHLKFPSITVSWIFATSRSLRKSDMKRSPRPTSSGNGHRGAGQANAWIEVGEVVHDHKRCALGRTSPCMSRFFCPNDSATKGVAPDTSDAMKVAPMRWWTKLSCKTSSTPTCITLFLLSAWRGNCLHVLVVPILPAINSHISTNA